MDNDSKIQVTWDIGTGYDMFVSLNVLHEPEKFGLRGSWAAGVRSRLPAPEREFLQDATDLIWPFGWVYSLPEPKDAETVLAALAALRPEERIPTIQTTQLHDSPAIAELLQDVAARGEWNEGDLKQLATFMQEETARRVSASTVRQMATAELNLWSDLKKSGEMLLSALTCYQEQFYAEEEIRIRGALQEALRRARGLAQDRDLPELLEELSQGVRLDKKLNMPELVLVPSFWATPLMIFAHISAEKQLFMFGARPSDMSLIPGDVVPDALYQALKALADPTRLRILRYLTEEPSTPADLARRLRLRSPTVIHHLDTLRLARLVQLTLSHEGKRYAIRSDAVQRTFELLNGFLGEAEGEWLELEELAE